MRVGEVEPEEEKMTPIRGLKGPGDIITQSNLL